jgi:membrane protein implicated in regulation of membrane protease activity
MSQTVNWILIIVGAVLVLIEILLGAMTGFDFLLIGSAVLAGGVLGLLTGSAPAGLVAAGVLALLYVFVGRRRIRDRLRRRGIPTNTDALLGRTVLVAERITPDRPGRIKHEGEEWRAHVDSSTAAPLEVGARAIVKRIDGVTTFVVPAEGGTAGAAREGQS